MTRISWNDLADRTYEAGVDQGVLFVLQEEYVGDPLTNGVPWNGLIAVTESQDGGEAKPFYMDGQKFLNLMANEDFAATIDAFSSPAEFGPCEGIQSIAAGLFVTQQRKTPFCFSYRTLIGNPLEGIDYGYKIHLVYNAVAGVSDRKRSTINNSTSPVTFSWPVNTMPVSPDAMSGLLVKPMAHLIVDSRTADPDALADLEDMLYGSVSNDATLLSPKDIAELLS